MGSIRFEDGKYISGMNYRIWVIVNEKLRKMMAEMNKIDELLLNHLSCQFVEDGDDVSADSF
jgi:hypothetical protein